MLAMFDMYRHFLLMFSSLWPVFRLLYGLNSKALARLPGLTPQHRPQADLNGTKTG